MRFDCTGFHRGLHRVPVVDFRTPLPSERAWTPGLSSKIEPSTPPVAIPGTRHKVARYRSGSGGHKMWFALAAITLAAAIGFKVLALAVQDREH